MPKHRSQRHKQFKRKKKNLCGFSWHKHEETWLGKLGKWLNANNKGKRIV